MQGRTVDKRLKFGDLLEEKLNATEDDVIELDGKPGRIVRVGIWKTVFFIYHVVDGNIVSADKLVVQNDKLKDMKISKPLPELDLRKYQNGKTWKRRFTDKKENKTEG